MKKLFGILAVVITTLAVLLLLWAPWACPWCGSWETCDCGGRIAAEKGEEEMPIFEQNQGYWVQVTSYDGSIQMTVPVEWKYEATEENRGIHLWHPDAPDCVIRVEAHPGGFGVCGTGLEEKPVTFRSGHSAVAGYYDGGKYWSYVSLGDGYAVTHSCPDEWWETYEWWVMEMLDMLTITEEEGL